jgi:hypothetical protein
MNVLLAQHFFVDDFEDEDIADGNPVTWLRGATDGSGQVTAGDLTLSGSLVTFYADLSNAFRDVSVRTQFRFLESSGNMRNAFVFARSPSAAGYFGGMLQNGELRIVESFEDGSSQTLVQTPTTMNPFNEDVLLRFDVIGNRLSLTAWHEADEMPGQPQLIAVDDSLTFGDVGIGIGGSDNASARVAFRNFAAVPEQSAVALAVLGTGSFSGFVLLRRRRLD